MKIVSALISFFCLSAVFSQTGGAHSFAALDLPFNARSMALGTDFISAKDQDINLAFSNPALYNEKMHNHMAFNHGIMPSGVNFGMLNYGRKFKNNITGGVALRYVSYGKMQRRDASGLDLGTFSPGEFVLTSGLGKQLNPNISVGANVNLIYSQLEDYSAFGASLDLAGAYQLEKANLLITVLAKNIGYQFKSYTKQNRSELPAEFQLAISHKLKHAPFRFSLLMHHLNQWDITYKDPTAKATVDPLSGDTIPVKLPGFGEKLARHFTYQVEVLVSKNIHIRMAFDYQRRQEMKLATRAGLSGFSTGFGLYFNRFSLDYGFLIHSAAGYSNMISLTTNLDKWKK